MDKTILKELKKIRNINGCLVATKLDNYKIEVNPKIIVDFINHLTNLSNEELEEDGIEIEVRNYLVLNLYNLLKKDSYEVVLKND
ncbi:hypothetical protein [uncultured Clostridium sp.]|uniref:hypothetical protein n=1 Tax=uncultured Clostridium sp. TaxID=59620 RepID=UPI0025F96798|nr:hypothetical protein [uncultured Clostridium sp.]MCI6458101.1 hypothetical protein [Clostridium sp.]